MGRRRNTNSSNCLRRQCPQKMRACDFPRQPDSDTRESTQLAWLVMDAARKSVTCSGTQGLGVIHY
jgi:hypothetical protein